MDGGIGDAIVISFYRYIQLGACKAAEVAAEQRRLGAELALCGRVLVAAEGINGTIQGTPAAVASYEASMDQSLGVDIDWKHSLVDSTSALFPDLVVKEVAELVNFGDQATARDGSKPLNVDAEGGTHLSPADFDRMLAETPAENLRVIDVRNSFEFQIGHFEGAMDPGMHHTAQWPRFVEERLADLRGRQVMLYCTGGIRCEKASAYLNRRLKETDGGENRVAGGVFQLDGGIHRYLEAFPDGGRFQGANFVFDKRVQQRPEGADGTIVGRCSECDRPWGRHHGGRVCCVCRALVLVCDVCDAESSHGEYYCPEHAELRGVYFHFIERFSAEELELQSRELRARIALEVGPRRKNRRTTLRKKAEQVEARLNAIREGATGDSTEAGGAAQRHTRRCRACEKPYTECPGACWGFWKRDDSYACGASMAEHGDEGQRVGITVGGG